MAYGFVKAFVPQFRMRAFVRPPLCRNYAVHGVPVRTHFIGHQGPVRCFQCPICRRNHTRVVS